MDEVTYKMIRDMFADSDKSAELRHENTLAFISEIRCQQLRSEDDRKEINKNIRLLMNQDSQRLADLWDAIEKTKKQIADNKDEVDETLLSNRFYNKNPSVFWQTFAIRIFVGFGVIISTLILVQQYRMNNTNKEVEAVKVIQEQVIEKQKTNIGKVDVLFDKEIKSINKPIKSKTETPIPIQNDTLKK